MRWLLGKARLGWLLRYNRTTGFTDSIYTNTYFLSTTYATVQDLDMTPDGRFVAYVANVKAISSGVSVTNTTIYLWDAQTATNVLISATTNNVLGTNNFCDSPVVSTDGQYVAFFSSGTPLATNATGTNWIAYLRNVTTGTTMVLNSDTNFSSAGDNSLVSLSLSPDGQCAAFESWLPSLVTNDDNRGYDVFLRNITNNFAELISARQSSLPSLTGVGSCKLSSQAISQDEHYVTFATDADGLAPGNTSLVGSDVYVCDLFAGTNQIVSVGIAGSAASGMSFEPVISGNGRYVAFTSAATNLITVDANKSTDVFVRDLQAQTTTLVSANSAGTGGGNADSYSPAISADERFILYASKANNLTAGSFGGTDNLFLRDLQLGTNYAVTTAGQSCVAMTPDAHFITFATVNGTSVYVWDSQQTMRVATNLTAGTVQALAISLDGNRIASVVGSSPYSISIWDRSSNVVYSIGSGYIIYSHLGLRFSADGRFLTYAMSSAAAGTNQVYRYDFQTQSNLLVSLSTNSIDAGNGTSDEPDISADGRSIIYRSAASNLVAGSTNGQPQNFLFDTVTGTTTVLSSSVLGSAAANNRSFPPMFSGDGHTLIFSSWGNNSMAGDFNQFNDVFAYAFLYATVTATGGTPTINWPAAAGRTYSVQYKDNLSDPTWQPLTGAVTIVGNRGYLTDATLASGHRFYQVVQVN